MHSGFLINIRMFINVFRKSCLVWDSVEKYFRTTDDNMAHAHCILDT